MTRCWRSTCSVGGAAGVARPQVRETPLPVITGCHYVSNMQCAPRSPASMLCSRHATYSDAGHGSPVLPCISPNRVISTVYDMTCLP